MSRPRFPEGRIGLSKTLSILGISKPTFYKRYRKNPHWIQHFEIRIDGRGRLNMNEQRVRDHAVELCGKLAYGRSARADRFQAQEARERDSSKD